MSNGIELSLARELGLTSIDNATAMLWDEANRYPGLLTVAMREEPEDEYPLHWDYYWHQDVWESIINGDEHAYVNSERIIDMKDQKLILRKDAFERMCVDQHALMKTLRNIRDDGTIQVAIAKYLKKKNPDLFANYSWERKGWFYDKWDMLFHNHAGKGLLTDEVKRQKREK
jgi:hypothetical protein